MSHAFARRLVAVALLAALSSPSLAGDAPKGKAEKKVCKIEREAVGRLPALKRCKTAAQWEADRQRQQGAASDGKGSNHGGSHGSAGAQGGSPN